MNLRLWGISCVFHCSVTPISHCAAFCLNFESAVKHVILPFTPFALDLLGYCWNGYSKIWWDTSWYINKYKQINDTLFRQRVTAGSGTAARARNNTTGGLDPRLDSGGCEYLQSLETSCPSLIGSSMFVILGLVPVVHRIQRLFVKIVMFVLSNCYRRIKRGICQGRS